jgi:hypothetical protein
MDISMRLYPSKKNLDLKLHVPDKETECPILQEPIESAVFDSFPRPFYRAHPEHKALTLGCSHTFHAMALVYHWSRNKNVLCPICRAGPRRQKLVMSTLPEDWRYSLTSKVRRETKRDKEETEREHMMMASMISRETTVGSTVVSFIIKIEIQAQTLGGGVLTWRLGTVFLPTNHAVVFEVPEFELIGIPPFGIGTLMRLIPFAYSTNTVNMLRPSEWFVSGRGSSSLGGGFSVEYGINGQFKGIKLAIHEDEFTSLIVDAYFAASTGL